MALICTPRAQDLAVVINMLCRVLAAGTMSVIGSGITDLNDPMLSSSFKFLREFAPKHLTGESHHYWYGQYYTAQVMFHSPDEKDWEQYWALAQPTLLEMQGENGLLVSWQLWPCLWNIRGADYSPGAQ